MRLAILKDNMLLFRNQIFEFSSIGPILFNMIFSQNNLISLCTYSFLTLKLKYSDIHTSQIGSLCKTQKWKMIREA